MPVAEIVNIRQSLHELWHETLLRADASDPRISVRPHELRSTTLDVGAAEDAQRGARAPSSGSSEPGLEDIDHARSGKERFALGSMLGRGGMSVVLHALQRSLGRGVAVKVARYDLDQRQRERFRAESQLTAWLEHPNIPPVYEAGRNYLVMRRISGSDLEHQLEAGQLILPQAIEVLIKACDAVSFAHHHGIIHRDIKPENIMVGDFGEVMLIDWGLALTWSPPADGVLRAPEIVQGSQLCAGTPGYMAPEMALAIKADLGPATDVFLLGATLYRCLSGDIPFAGTDAWLALERSARNQWTPIATGVAPRRLVALQEAAMMVDPRARPSLAEFQAGLREWLMRSQSEAEAQSALEGARRRFVVARGSRLRPHESYHDLIDCIAECDRALALNPDLEDAAIVRAKAVAEFILAAVGAGELQLARLIKNNGRLPAFPRQDGSRPAPRSQSGEESALIRRIGSLLPGSDRIQGEVARRLVQEVLARQHMVEQLDQENANLRASYDAVVQERDALASHAADSRIRRRWRLRWSLTVVVGLVLAGLIVAWWS